MASKNELEVLVTSLQSRFNVLEEGLMQTSRGLRGELTAVTELLVKVRNDLDRLRADSERVKNTVETLRNLQANYKVETKSF